MSNTTRIRHAIPLLVVLALATAVLTIASGAGAKPKSKSSACAKAAARVEANRSKSAAAALRRCKKRHPSSTAPIATSPTPTDPSSVSESPPTETPAPPPSVQSPQLLRPNADVTSQWTVCCSVAGAASALNDNVTQAQSSVPADQFVYASQLNTVTEVALSTASLNGATPATGSKAWFYMNTALGQSVRADVIWGGSVRGTTTVAGGQDYQWRSIGVIPPDQASVDDLRIRFTVTAAPPASSGNIFATYFELVTTGSGAATPPSDLPPSDPPAPPSDPPVPPSDPPAPPSDPPAPPPQRTLTVTPPSGGGSGSITGTGINCPGDCSETYDDGTAVTLSANATSGSTFAGWSGSCSGTGSCALNMNASKAISGTFNTTAPTPPAQRTLTVTPPSGGGSGSITGTGINCPGDCSETYADGTAVTLGANATGGSTFAGWSGSCSGTSSCALSMSANKSVSGSFNPPVTPPSGESPPPGMSLLRSDPMTNPDPEPLWGNIECGNDSRVSYSSSGGPNGLPYRTTTVLDGDDFYGERCEIGRNERRYGYSSAGDESGTFMLYNPGDHKVTSYWMRLPADFPINTNNWQVVMQMKQAQPNLENISSPILALEARQGQLEFRGPKDESSSAPYFAAPVTPGQWIHISYDIVYSSNPAVGTAVVTLGNQTSGVIHVATLATQVGNNSGLSDGQAIPGHLRLGPYHDASLPSTHVDFSDVRVYG
jgi:Polysaccharide lyase/Divergent InlB B-repeat domain